MNLPLRPLLLTALYLATATLTHAQAMPSAIQGSWRITRILPTTNKPCWTPAQAAKLVGSTLRYRQGAMVWQGGEVPTPEALTRTLTRRHFQDEYHFDLTELGIRTDSITEIDLQHEDADITGATTEVPGDTILLASPARIIVSACNVYYEALRPTPK